VRLARAQTCVPRGTKVVDGEMPPDDAVFLVLESTGNDLVVCGQAQTRRGASVFLDPVSYACWNVDPKTAFLTRRRDIVRGWFGCADGMCAPDTRQWPSYDGTRTVRVEDDSKKVEILDRTASTLVTSFARPPEFGDSPLTGELALMPTTIIAVESAAKKVHVFDLTGKHLASAAGDQFHVVSPGAVIAGTDDVRLQRIDLATHAVTKLDAVPEAKSYWWSTVEHRGTVYAVDNATRMLFVLDPKTFAVTSRKQLAICP